MEIVAYMTMVATRISPEMNQYDLVMMIRQNYRHLSNKTKESDNVDEMICDLLRKCKNTVSDGGNGDDQIWSYVDMV
jgi:cell division protein FtsL